MAQVIRSRLQRAAILIALPDHIGTMSVYSHLMTADKTLEYQVKATHLPFCPGYRWPAGALGAPDSPFNICVLGSDRFGGALEQIVSGEVVAGRKVAIQKIDRNPQPGSCRNGFRQRSVDRRSATTSGPGRRVLTVGPGQAFAQDGGHWWDSGNPKKPQAIHHQQARTYGSEAGLDFDSVLLAVAEISDPVDGTT